jgi:hypothetical protein
MEYGSLIPAVDIFLGAVSLAAANSLTSLACHLPLPSQETHVKSSCRKLDSDAHTIDKSAVRPVFVRWLAEDKSLCPRHLGSENRRFQGRTQ